MKYGTELIQGDMNPPVFDEPGTSTDIAVDAEGPFTSVSNITWKQGRSLLRQYVSVMNYAARCNVKLYNLRSTNLISC